MDVNPIATFKLLIPLSVHILATIFYTAPGLLADPDYISHKTVVLNTDQSHTTKNPGNFKAAL